MSSLGFIKEWVDYVLQCTEEGIEAEGYEDWEALKLRSDKTAAEIELVFGGDDE